MTHNPYGSPTPGETKSKRRGKFFFCCLAVVFWLLALSYVIEFLPYLDTPENIELRATKPAPFWGMVAIIAALPAMGLALLGFASWLRIGWLALLGIAMFLPMIIATAAVIFWL